MDIRKIRLAPRRSRRTKAISIRITPEIYGWLKRNRFSTTKIFYEALKELGCPFVKDRRERK
jgi:hypothetical protein